MYFKRLCMVNRINIEDTIKRIVSSKGYILNYKETPASSSEDMYEITFWLEDRNLQKFDYKTIWIRDKKNPKNEAFRLLLNEFIEDYYSRTKVKPTMEEILIDAIKAEINEGLKDCSLPPVAFNVVKETLENCGYILSSDKEQIYDDIETNGWQCDYYMYIWKSGKYTGYALHGSYYYGDHKIEKDEINRE